mmetsp:Transcript_130696/g.260769  ORF Transcript_130696/g.260769 Transcript_130696/m.260769 type:complete len:84 (+) Transcript_130696:735-986(+)
MQTQPKVTPTTPCRSLGDGNPVTVPSGPVPISVPPMTMTEKVMQTGIDDIVNGCSPHGYLAMVLVGWCSLAKATQDTTAVQRE